jgi:hypothetical protein
MARGRVGDGPEIEEVWSGARAADGGRPGRSPGDGRRGRPRIGRWLPIFAVGGLAVLIVGAGLLGPKVPAPVDPGPATPTAAPAASGGPAGSPDGAPTGAASPGAETPIPALRLSGALPDDRFILLAGRWVDLATGTADGPETGCELERPLVLAGGRIICVTQKVARPAGSKRATYDLAIVTVGRSRTAPAEPWARPPRRGAEGVRPAVPLLTLVGRRDLTSGSPVAIAVAPGMEPDSLLLAWAVLGDAGYRVGLDRYRIGDAEAVQTGSREVLALPLENERGATSLADLTVSVSPEGRTALVGVTVAGTPTTPGVRWLAVLRMGAAAGPDDGALGVPLPLPDTVTGNATGPADVARDDETACGGALGEGWATEGTLFLVCPGRPSVFRRVVLPSEWVDELPGPGAPDVAAEIADETAFTPASGADATWLAGNGVAIDRLRGRYYRWSPWARILWSIDLAGDQGAQPTIRSVTLGDGTTGIGPIVPGDGDRAARPVLALDAPADRLYLLAPDAAGRGARVEVVDGANLDSRGSGSTSLEPYATLALSPDRQLLYLATPPRGIVGAPRPLVAVEVLDTDPLAERLFAGRLPPGAWDPTEPLVVR